MKHIGCKTSCYHYRERKTRVDISVAFLLTSQFLTLNAWLDVSDKVFANRAWLSRVDLVHPQRKRKLKSLRVLKASDSLHLLNSCSTRCHTTILLLWANDSMVRICPHHRRMEAFPVWLLDRLRTGILLQARDSQIGHHLILVNQCRLLLRPLFSRNRRRKHLPGHLRSPMVRLGNRSQLLSHSRRSIHRGRHNRQYLLRPSL